MPTISIKPKQLASALRGEGKRVARAIVTGSYRAAQRFKAHLVDQCDARGITDQGVFKNAFRVVKTTGGATVSNDAPHAGVIELGARPHPIGAPVRALIAAWCVRKLGMDPKDAARMAYFIGLKIEREGQKPTYIIRNNLPKAKVFFAEEVVRILNNRGGQAEAA